MSGLMKTVGGLFAVGSLLAACGGTTETVAHSSAQLTVTGPAAAVERFVSLQGSRIPALQTSTPVELDNGFASVIVTLPSGYTGDDLQHTTREALAAGLSYDFTQSSLRVSRDT